MANGKIPIGATVFGSFGLARRHWRSVVRIAWLPILLSSLVAAWPLTRFPNRDLTGLDPEEVASVMSVFNGLSMAATFTGVILMTMAYVGLFRFFFREEEPRIPAYIHWGIDEWRVLGATIVMNVIIIATLFAFILVAVVLSSVLYGFAAALGIAPPLEQLANLDPTGSASTSAFLSIAILWLIALFIGFITLMLWITARLMFFYPGPVAEQALNLGALFRLTEGHAARLVAILFLWGLITYGSLFIVGYVMDLLIFQGAIREYVILLGWSPALGAPPFDPWQQMPKLIIGAFLANMILKAPLAMMAPLYVLAYLFRVEESEQSEA